MKPVQALGAAATGAVAGASAAGLWWMARDRTSVCLGGCSPGEKNLPPGDITLAGGAVVGALLAVVVLLLLVRSQHRR